jgi:hypothetical protein
LLTAILIFAGTYLVLAIGRLPGFRVDRTGAAIVGASLMISVVANLRFSGFFALVSAWIVEHTSICTTPPHSLLRNSTLLPSTAALAQPPTPVTRPTIRAHVIAVDWQKRASSQEERPRTCVKERTGNVCAKSFRGEQLHDNDPYHRSPH